MYQKLNPNQIIDEETKIKGTTIFKLCEYDSGPYKRIKEWCEKKINQLPERNEIDQDNKEFERIMKECLDLMKERNVRYGQSWKVMKIQTIANLCEMKLNRISNMEKYDPKIVDEMKDVLNYMVFGLMKANEYNINNQ